MKYHNLFKRSGSNNIPRLFPSVVKFVSQNVKKDIPWLCLIALVVALTLQSATPAPAVYAASLNVNSTSDMSVAGDGLCTLREAIINANSDSDTTTGDCMAGNGDDTITFSVTGVITLGSMLPITTNITISGPGATVLTISGNKSVPILIIRPTGKLSVEKLTLADAHDRLIGAIYNQGGTLLVTNSTFSGNHTTEGGAITNVWSGLATVANSAFTGNDANYGGAIFSDSGSISITNSDFSGNIAGFYGGAIQIEGGTLTVTSSTFSNNTIPLVVDYGWGGGAGISNTSGTVEVINSLFSGNTVAVGAGLGGGIFNQGTFTVTNSTFSGNAAYEGGGIHNRNNSRLSVDHSTFTGNSASQAGGGISNKYNAYPIAITNSTFSGNTGDYWGGGGIFNLVGTVNITNDTFSGNNTAIYNHPSYSTVMVRNTILAYNTAANCGGELIDGGHNLQFPSEGGCEYAGIPTADPMLGPLQDNSGPTFTHALQPGSPAIDAVPLEACAGIITDQRGVTRPQGPACDIGAFEFFSPQKSLEGLIEKLRELTGSGVLNQGQGNALIAKLEAAIQQLGRGNDHVVINQLQAFINEAEAMIRSGILLPEDGQPLIDAANEIITILSS